MRQGNVALCIPLLTQQSQLVPRAAPVLLWVSQHYNIMCFCGEKRGKGPEFSHILPAAKLFLFLLYYCTIKLLILQVFIFPERGSNIKYVKVEPEEFGM